jgi:uncharacterized protein YkuJ
MRFIERKMVILLLLLGFYEDFYNFENFGVVVCVVRYFLLISHFSFSFVD